MKLLQCLLCLMMMMMMKVSAAPFPPPLNSSRPDDKHLSQVKLHLLKDAEENSTRATVPQGDRSDDVSRNTTAESATNSTRDMDRTRDVVGNSTRDVDRTRDVVGNSTRDVDRTRDVVANSTGDVDSSWEVDNTGDVNRTGDVNSTWDVAADGNRTDAVMSSFILHSGRRVVAADSTYHSGCLLPTCGLVNLGSALQRGDEKAGGLTTDPLGIGKK